MRRLHTHFVRQPELTYLSPAIELNPKFLAFNGAIGAIDGTLIPAHIPKARQQRFWSRKNNISQNIFAAVTFDGLFCYVLAGAEGSINDSALLRQVLTRSFVIPIGRFWLGDAGFGLQRGILTPYNHNVRYHLQDWGTATQRPQNQQELFNLRHAQKRTIVEHVFGRCKRKWKIIRHSAAEYKLLDQIRIIYAVTGLFNFVKLGGRTLEQHREEERLILTDREQDLMDLALEYADEVLPPLDGPGTQEHVASRAWRHYQQHLTEEDDNTDYFDSGNSDSSDDDDENSDGGDGDDENDENDSVDDG
jgi:hypothetical protein